MDNGHSGKLPASFSAEQVQAVLGSEAGKQLLSLLNRDGGKTLCQAAQALKNGDSDAAQQLLSPLMQTPQAQELIHRINEKKG